MHSLRYPARAVRALDCAVAAGSILLIASMSFAANPAFSGAEGPGATASGGRGGDVYHVTNLHYDLAGTVPGSFNYGIKSAPSNGRTIVFDVGGTIYWTSDNTTSNSKWNNSKGKITIAGQTAPGPGISIVGAGTKWTGDNVILRNITVRPGLNSKNTSFDAFDMQLKNSIVDHVTATWFTDEGISQTDAGHTTTVQYANASQGLNNLGHSFGAIIATEVDGANLSYHHNLFAHNKSRNPRLGSETGTTGAVLNFSNNVMYDWESGAGYTTSDQPSSTNFLSNYYIKGAVSNNDLFYGANLAKVYEDGGNKYDSNLNKVIDGTFPSTIFANQYIRSTTPFTVAGVGVADTADVALQRVTDYGGANWQSRNPIDQKIIDTVKTVGGGIILTAPTADLDTVLAQKGDANGNSLFTRDASFDTDKDGMPNAWEAAHGLNAAVANNNADFDNDGYTDVEEYINDLGAWPSGKTLVFNNANANTRYAEINNWGNLWQPSRYDSAQINTGTLKIDAAGQHARNLTVAPSSGNSATLQMTAGWLDVRETLTVGNVGAGTVTHSGGMLRAGTSVVIGGTSTPSTYNLSGGTLATPLLKKGNASSAFNITGGVLHADKIEFSLINQGGTIAPGSDAELQMLAAASMKSIGGAVETVLPFVGTTQVTGDLTLQSGLVQIDLASPTSFDKISVSNTLALGGNLGIVLINGYTPPPGTQWQIFTANNITGNFVSVTPGFAMQSIGGTMYLVALPEPGSISIMALSGLLLGRRRMKSV